MPGPGRNGAAAGPAAAVDPNGHVGSPPAPSPSAAGQGRISVGRRPRRDNPGARGRAWPSTSSFAPPSPAAAGEGAGGVRVAPARPAARCGCSYRSDTSPCPPRRRGETKPGEGPALPRAPGLPRRGGFPAAFQRRPPPVRRRRERGSNSSGEGPCLPRTPGLSRRDRFPTEPCLSAAAAGEGGTQQAQRGSSPPPDPRIAAARSLLDEDLPLSAAAGERAGGEGSPNRPGHEARRPRALGSLSLSAAAGGQPRDGAGPDEAGRELRIRHRPGTPPPVRRHPGSGARATLTGRPRRLANDRGPDPAASGRAGARGRRPPLRRRPRWRARPRRRKRSGRPTRGRPS